MPESDSPTAAAAFSPDGRNPDAPSFVGQLCEGAYNTPLYRLTVTPGRLVFRYRREKALPRDAVRAVRLWRAPLVGWIAPGGVCIEHDCGAFHQRLVFKTFRCRAVIEACAAAGYPIDGT
ncbi:hypothetical protein [Botrimarina mediterranea]|uniref:Uncharacterized protein n=1 Tax=Botrimarina mediterranea TaxID=2528022 RepID=A0A518K4U5_9BACT|nr:hypothetical protein [Botrimarina mediterranea]QDV72812.1 hypothetical protein Spa11_09940 [Botrimarina mediterranea]